MTIAEIYQKFDQIGCLSFTTINAAGEPESRIAHLRAHDQDGIYFMTMFTKDFYAHLKNNGHLALCGLHANTQVSHDANGMPVFEGGYAIRMTGKVREVSIEEIKTKNATASPMFDMCIKDYEQYPAMVVFCITDARGDIFDYDFEKTNRDHKLERVYFSYNSMCEQHKGLQIDATACVGCGTCAKKCSFSAIQQQSSVYAIDPYRCDECGDCYLICPVKAISYRHGGAKKKRLTQHPMESKMQRCVIIAGADIHNEQAVKNALKKDDFFICCDSGLKHRTALGIEPNLIVGDFDSHENLHLEIETIVLPREKDDTDTMFGIKTAIERGFEDFLLVGVIGERFDHSLVNISSLVYLHTLGKSAKIIDDYSEMEILNGTAYIEDCFPYFSVIALGGDIHGLTIENAKFPLENGTITMGYQYGISNEVLPGKCAKVTLNEGLALIIKVR